MKTIRLRPAPYAEMRVLIEHGWRSKDNDLFRAADVVDNWLCNHQFDVQMVRKFGHVIGPDEGVR